MELRSVVLALACFFFASPATSQNASSQEHLVQDWSTGHVIFTRLTPETVDDAIRLDPRAWHVWLNHAGYDFKPNLSEGSVPLHERGSRHHPHKAEKLKTDWAMPIGTNAPEWASPAKFGFNVNNNPDCVNDYVVFPTANVPSPGSSGLVSPTLIAFNNLYTGPGPTGICPTPVSPATQPSVLFAYNTATTTGGEAALSPVLSLDGKKVAFIESGSISNYTAFHVLTWLAGEGSLSSTALPGDCSVGQSCMTTLVLSSVATDSRSNPFVDYAHDTAYVGDNNGLLHKITSVFNGTPQEVIGNGWPVQIGAQLGSAVYDSVSGFIFAPDGLGFSGALHIVNASTGAIVNAIPIRSTFRLSDPIVDSTDQTVFLFFSAYPSFDLTVMEFDTSGTLLGQVGVGALGGDASVFTGAFDHRYFVNPSSGLLYFAGDVNSVASLYSVSFTGGIMNSSANGPLFLSTSSFTSEPTRLTEFYNPSFSVAPDRLFVPIEENCTGGPTNSDGCVESVNISNGLPSGILNSYSVLGFSSPPPMSGIIVDNVSASPEASSIYFEATPPSGPSTAAIKLTQSSLQ